MEKYAQTPSEIAQDQETAMLHEFHEILDFERIFPPKGYRQSMYNKKHALSWRETSANQFHVQLHCAFGLENTIVLASSLVRITDDFAQLQPVFKLFNQDLTIATIAHECNSTVAETIMELCRLHRAGRINLVPWIQTAVPNKALSRAMEMQRKNPQMTMDMASESDMFCLARIYQRYLDGIGSKKSEE